MQEADGLVVPTLVEPAIIAPVTADAPGPLEQSTPPVSLNLFINV